MISNLLIIFVTTLFVSALFSLGIFYGAKRQHTSSRMITEGIICLILLILITSVVFICFSIGAMKGLGAGVVVGIILALVIEAPLIVIITGLFALAFSCLFIILLGSNLSRIAKSVSIDSRLRSLLHILPFIAALIMTFQYLSNLGFENIGTDEASGVLARVEIANIRLDVPPVANLRAYSPRFKRMVVHDESRGLDKSQSDIVEVTRFNRVQLYSLNIPEKPEAEICFSVTKNSSKLCSSAIPTKAILLIGKEIPNDSWNGKTIRARKNHTRVITLGDLDYLYRNRSSTGHKEITPIEPLKIGQSKAHFVCQWRDRNLFLESCISKNKDPEICEKRYEDMSHPKCRGYLELRPELYYQFTHDYEEALEVGDFAGALRLTVQDLTQRANDFERFVSAYSVKIERAERK